MNLRTGTGGTVEVGDLPIPILSWELTPVVWEDSRKIEYKPMIDLGPTGDVRDIWSVSVEGVYDADPGFIGRMRAILNPPRRNPPISKATRKRRERILRSYRAWL